MIRQHRKNKWADRLACQSRMERMRNRRIARLRKVANTRKMLTLIFKDTFPFVKDPPMFISKLAKDISEWVPNWVGDYNIFPSDVTVTKGVFEWSDSSGYHEEECADEVTARVSVEFPFPVSHSFLSTYRNLISDQKGFIKATKNIGRDKEALTLLGKLLKDSFLPYFQNKMDGHHLMSYDEIEEKVQEVESIDAWFLYDPKNLKYKPAKAKIGPHGILIWAWLNFDANPDEAGMED